MLVSPAMRIGSAMWSGIAQQTGINSRITIDKESLKKYKDSNKDKEASWFRKLFITPVGANAPGVYRLLEGHDLLTSMVEGPRSGLWMKPGLEVAMVNSTYRLTLFNNGANGLVERFLIRAPRYWAGHSG